MTASPILLVHDRGGADEAIHRGIVCVVSSSDVVLSRGDVDRETWLRSVAKPFQAAAALRAGVAETYALSKADVALLCASHNSEDRHVERARALLARGGFDERDLRCGAHPPISPEVDRELARRGEAPSPLRNNCSGKHAGMLLLARVLEADPARYLDPDGPVQRAAAAAVSAICAPADAPGEATDGCSAVTFRLPLRALATGFRRLADPDSAPGDWAAPLRTARDAMTAHPEMVAGLDRFDTDLMAAGEGRFVAKIGAEGLIGCGVRDEGLGIAIKIEDGAMRAYPPVLLAVLEHLGLLSDAERGRLTRWRDDDLKNCVGTVVGRRRVVLADESGG